MNESVPTGEDGFHPWLAELGAYVVGALEPDEARELRRHLADCPVCQAEYQDLTSVTALLAEVPAEAFEPAAGFGADTASWERLRARAGLAPLVAPQRAWKPEAAPPAPMPHARPRSRSRLRWPSRPGASAALSGALVALAAAGVFVGVQAAGNSSAAVDTVSAANSVNGVSGTVEYRPTAWGSWVQVTLKGVPRGDNCVMYAVDFDGNKSVAGSWWVPYSGAQTATIPGGVAMEASNIRQFVVETTDGNVLLTVPVS
ncbi:anti-sigma factor family protein [Actinospica robiniae]|uniref:anti-sigma factor family protein n=1 Tax=Actinospica robiniae TaxID=304901 RepID=UPI00041EC4DC|nr:zf-HC2 domain-containing protein [Actinospica robiniae]